MISELIKRNHAIIVLIEVAHNFFCQLRCLFLTQGVLLDEVVHKLFRLYSAVLIAIKSCEYIPKIPFFLLVKLLLLFKFSLRFQVFLFVSNLLLLLQVFLFENLLKIIAHILCLLRVLNCLLGPRVQVSIGDR